ncbi:Cortical cell-delineating protein [Zea mays]|uniref:Cortical cell-delineating protein n=1 Tax=Zea mays TaxID=4577 RepID=A0A317YHM8_MAIZE|nr:Cortical cell-delineating protein [Zea mays]
MATKSIASLLAVALLLLLLSSPGAVVVVRAQQQQRGNPCPTNAVADLKVCADVLVLLKLKINVPQSQRCCPLLGSLVNLDLAACLCATIRLNVLGIPVNLPLDVPLVLNYCGRNASAVPGSNCSF